LPDNKEINPTPNDKFRALVKFMNSPPAGTEDGLRLRINQGKMKLPAKAPDVLNANRFQLD